MDKLGLALLALKREWDKRDKEFTDNHANATTKEFVVLSARLSEASIAYTIVDDIVNGK